MLSELTPQIVTPWEDSGGSSVGLLESGQEGEGSLVAVAEGRPGQVGCKVKRGKRGKEYRALMMVVEIVPAG